MLEPFSESIWTASTPVRFAGVWFPHVMTIVRLASGTLLLHSPCRSSGVLIGEIAALGTVSDVIAPNWFHDLYLAEYRRLYPKARFWAPGFLQRRRKRIIDADLDGGVPPWFEELPYTSLRGLMTFDECIFFHGASKTLIVADLLMSYRVAPRMPWYTQFAGRLFGLDGTLKTFQLLWFLTGRNRTILRGAARWMIACDPKGLIVGHGEPVKGEISSQLRRAFRWLDLDRAWPPPASHRQSSRT